MFTLRFRTLVRVLSFAATLAVPFANPATAASCNAVVGVWPLGPSYRVAFDGNVVLLARGRELSIFGTANPNTTPPLLGRVILPGQPKSIATSAVTPGLAAVALDGEGVALVSYSNPAAPVLTQHFAVGGKALAVAFGPTGDSLGNMNERLFVARGNLGLQIVEHDNPSGPVLRGSFVHTTPNTSNSQDVVVAAIDTGSGWIYRAYIAEGGSGVSVLNVANPDAPSFLVGSPLIGSAAALSLLYHHDGTLGGNQTRRLFVGAGSAGLRAFSIDLNGHLADQQTFTWSGPGENFYVEDLARDGFRLFAASSYGGLRVVDIHNTAAMFELARSGSTPGRVHGVAAGPTGHAWVAAEQAGMIVYQFLAGPPATLPARASFATTGSTEDVAGNDRYAFLADSNYGLVVVDLLAPGGPALAAPLGSFFYTGTSVALAGNLAVVGDSFGNVRIVDISTPTAPIELGVVNVVSAPIKAIAVAGTHAYVATSSGSLLAVVDFSTPAAPVVQDTVPLGFWASGVALLGTHAYVTLEGTTDLAVIDVSDPNNLVLLPNAPLGTSSDIAVSGGVGLLVRAPQLVTLGLSTPATPAEIGSVTLPGNLVAPAVVGSSGYAHVATLIFDTTMMGYLGRTYSVDVRTPSAPIAYTSLSVPGAKNIAVAGDRLLTASAEMGAAVLTNCVVLLRDGFEDGASLPGRWSAKIGS